MIDQIWNRPALQILPLRSIYGTPCWLTEIRTRSSLSPNNVPVRSNFENARRSCTHSLGGRHCRVRTSGEGSRLHRERGGSARGPAVSGGCVAACTHVAFDYDRVHPFLHSGTGPFTKMGLDNPDTMYFGTRWWPATSTSSQVSAGPPPTSASSCSGANTPTKWSGQRNRVRRPQARHRRRRHLRVAIHPG